MENLKETLKTSGYIFLKNRSQAELEKILNELGEVINETDVIAKEESKSLVTSNNSLDFHTDNHLAKHIVWYCHQPADEGGFSMLCDAEKVFTKLQNDEKQQLSKIHVFEHKVFPENRNSNPIVRENNGSRKFYYSFWLTREKYRKNPVLLKWKNLIKESKHIKIRLNKRDLLIIDNHRILHGRTKIAGKTQRFLKRYWLR